MEDKSIIDTKQISQAAHVILEVAQKTSKPNLIQPVEDKPIVLQCCFKKIPNVHNQVIKIFLPVSIAHSTTEICLFTKDLDKANRDYDPTVRHFKDLLNHAGIKEKIDVIPMKCLTLEYQPYEAKRNLSNMYDVFLVDERIGHRVPNLLGKHFIGRKKYPVRVNLTSRDLKKEIEKALATTLCVITGHGTSFQVPVARTGMAPKDIAKNIEAALRKLEKTIPGGPANMRSVSVKTLDSPALPIYVSLGKRDDIKLPKMKIISQELEPEEVTTVEHALVKVTKSGNIILVKKPRSHEDPDSDEQLSEEDQGEDDNKTNSDLSKEEDGSLSEEDQATDEESSSGDVADVRGSETDEETTEDNLDKKRRVSKITTLRKQKTPKKRSHSPESEETGSEEHEIVKTENIQKRKRSSVVDRPADAEVSQKKRKTSGSIQELSEKKRPLKSSGNISKSGMALKGMKSSPSSKTGQPKNKKKKSLEKDDKMKPCDNKEKLKKPKQAKKNV